MAETEIRQPEHDKTGDLRDQIHGVRLEVRDQIHGVRLEVEKLRTDMTDQVGDVRLEVEKVRTEVARTETTLVEKIGGVESRLSDRMDGLERSLRGWLVMGVSVIGAMIALLGLFG